MASTEAASAVHGNPDSVSNRSSTASAAASPDAGSAARQASPSPLRRAATARSMAACASARVAGREAATGAPEWPSS